MSDTPTTAPAEPFIPPAPVKVERNGIMLPIASIDTSNRIRDVTEAGAAMMADSLAAKGLISAILVRPVGEDRYRLVIGGHRIAGAEMLQWREIRCDVREMDDDEAEDMELRENLDRTDLTKLDQMIFMSRRKALDVRMAERPKAGGDRQTAKGNHSANVGGMVLRLTQELAEQVGRSERAVQRAIQIVDNLDPEAIRLIRGTKHANNEQTLFKLSQHAPAKQRTLAAKFKDDGAKTIAQAAVLAGFEEPVTEDPQETHYGKLCRAWDDADEKTKARFLNLIDAAIVGSAATMTPEMRKALAGMAAPSTEPSRDGRKPGKGVR